MALPTQYSMILPVEQAPLQPGVIICSVGASSGLRYVASTVWVWCVVHGAGFIQDGLLGQVQRQLCPLDFVDSEMVTNAVFLLTFA